MMTSSPTSVTLFTIKGRPASRTLGPGANFRLTNSKVALLAQLARLEQQTRTRDKNAAYLRTLLGEIPGITPARLHAGCTRSSYHLFMLWYDSPFRTARAVPAGPHEEGVAASGYEPLNTSDQARALATNPHYRRVYGRGTMDKWQERNQCPVNDRLCEEAVWFSQRLLARPAFGNGPDCRRGAPSAAKLRRTREIVNRHPRFS